jgi:nucleoid DNA-binding protein
MFSEPLDSLMPKENYRPLAAVIAKKHGLTTKQVADFQRLLIEEISERLCSGEDVALRGFGTFVVKTARAKAGRNPKKPGTSHA